MNRALDLTRTVTDAGLLLALQMAAGAAPEWIQLLPPSPVATRDARGPYTFADPAALIRASMTEAGGRLPIDENHSTDLAGPAGLSAPAVGWIVEMEAREGSIWGRVEWNETGRRLVSERAYRGVSPVFLASKKGGQISMLLRAALTNTPNLRGLEAVLHHQENDDMDELLKQLAAALGLAVDADQAAIVARAAELGKRPATEVELQSAMAPIAAALGAGVEANGAAIVTAIGERLDPAKVVPAEAVRELQSQLAALTTGIAKGKAEAVVDAAIAAGKAGVKPLRDHYIARHMKDPTGVEKELQAMPAVAPGRLAMRDPEAKPGTAGALDEVQRHAADLIGVSHEAYAKTLAAEAAKGEAA